MATLNTLLCGQNVSNTGVPQCYFDPKVFKSFVIVPNGYELTKVELDNLTASLLADSKAANKLSRIYFVHDVVNVTSNSEEKTVQTFGATGAKAVVREGKYDWTLQFVKGGMTLSNNLRKFNSNGGWSVLFVDVDGGNVRVMGRKGAVATSLYGIPTDFIWTNPVMPNTGSEVAVYATNIVIDPVHFNENIGFAVGDSSILDIAGLRNANIELVSFVGSTGVATLVVKDDVGTNLSELYASELANVANFVARNAQTNGAINISSVSYNSVLKHNVVTIDTADSDYPAAGLKLTLALASIATLELQNIVGFEGANVLTLTR